MRVFSAFTGLFLASMLFFGASTASADSSFDRELVVKDETRGMKVEVVFKELMRSYEDEDAHGFLDLVSDERFRQDYMTFTDALYSDFREYEIHQVEYWIDRVVPDNVKQYLYVRWEKRYELLYDGRQLTQTGFSRFLFDEVDGQYKLVELAGNTLFGGSLQEWREEQPVISGQEIELRKIPGTTPPVAGGGTTPPVTGGGTAPPVTGGGTTLPDLVIIVADQVVNSVGLPDYAITFTVQNIGTAASGPCMLLINPTTSGAQLDFPIPALQPGEQWSTPFPEIKTELYNLMTIDAYGVVAESNEGNNTYNLPQPTPPVVGQPDLSVPSGSLSFSFPPTATFTVNNGGTADSPATDIAVYAIAVDPVNLVSCPGGNAVAAITAGSSTSFSCDVSSALSVSGPFIGVVDPNNTVAESDETNNQSPDIY